MQILCAFAKNNDKVSINCSNRKWFKKIEMQISRMQIFVRSLCANNRLALNANRFKTDNRFYQIIHFIYEWHDKQQRIPGEYP